MEKKTVITCIACPLGCTLEVTKQGDEFNIEGNKCKKGIEYAKQELTNPMRSITSTVKTTFSDFPRLSVKTDAMVPLKDIFLYMEEINSLVIDQRLKPGDVVKNNLRGSEVNLVATNDMSEIE